MGVARFLRGAPQPAFVAYAIAASFAAYFCMYAFRKPFAAASFEGSVLGLELKTVLVISQVLGYTLSKYIGIKVVSELRRPALGLLLSIGGALAALALFGVLPGGAKAIAIFANGLCLGMVWGMVVRYLEGRQTSELLLAGLSCSFIVASGVVKDLGRWLLAEGVSEGWMPFWTGLLFVLPFAAAVWLLERLPPPTEEDRQLRSERRPMSRAERIAFLRRFGPGLASLLLVYFFLTAYRDFRDNYGVEIFTELGYGETPAVFSATELPVALGVLLALGLLYRIRDNRRALLATFAIMIVGAFLLVGSTMLRQAGYIDGVTWMVATGLGSYLVYVPYGSILFDRLVATTGAAGTAVFAIYVADALGYTGSVGVQLYKDLAQSEVTRLGFFEAFTYAQGAGGVLLLVLSATYFLRRS
ncbi:MAG: DUF5690 family protein [Myxococcota bacterium]